MTSLIIALKNSVLTEITKQKKTLALWGTILAPLFVVTVNFLIFFSHPELLKKADTNPWLKIAGNAINIYSILMLPLLITLVAFMVNNVDHKAYGWKHLFALPVSRATIYISKIVVAAGMVLLSLGLFDAFLILSGNLLSSAHPEIRFENFAMNNEIIITSIKVFLASLLILLIQFGISINSKNFLVSIGIGVAGTIGTSMLLSWEHSNWIPYALPMWAAQDLYKMDFSFLKEVVFYSIAGSSIVFTAGLISIRKKNIN
jgi:hypothetical protein